MTMLLLCSKYSICRFEWESNNNLELLIGSNRVLETPK